MLIDIYTKTPESLLALILDAINENSSAHMNLWETVYDSGEDYLTLTEIKYYFKVLLKPEAIEGIKLRFSFVFHHDYSDNQHFVKCEYASKFTEYILCNFIDHIRGIQIFPK